ncbi:MAG: B12-binding domain-containing radical SAM protein [Deltaproteobacteria bacterium]|nr:B12-binding domain-containing radical SAM protein [Deltaproteobacteria bacterium]MCL5791886.1 B12-binding domain-containing radical SAM protein [Deltaproteobacteria bacterium]
MKVLLINSPKYYWPFINEYDNFLLPQSLVYLAGILREHDIEVKIIDTMPLKMGWKTLANRIKEEKPDVVGVGESHALYAHESEKLISLVKEINPKIKVIAGGAHFTNLYNEYLNGDLGIDFIVRGEGELTLLELIKSIEQGKDDFVNIKGIAFKQDGKIIQTPYRPLIEDLDTLPMPAYDLVPMNQYGNSRYLFSPGGTTINHSRGCTSNCSFCVWWTQMADRKNINGKEVLKPRWRTKSVNKTMEEILLLYHTYNKRALVFVDDSWNINPEWEDEFATELIKQQLKLNWFAFMRADLLLRDERLGILEKLVKSGLSHLCVGVERAENNELKQFGKPFYSHNASLEIFHILKKKYPSVFLQATFIVGVYNETEESMYEQLKFAKKLKPDYPAFHPLTPVPGTPLYNEVIKSGLLEIKDFSMFDWLTPVMPSKYLSRERIEELVIELNRNFINIRWLIKGMLSPYAYKRRMYIWWFLVLIKVLWSRFISKFRWIRPKEIIGLIKPEWYDK